MPSPRRPLGWSSPHSPANTIWPCPRSFSPEAQSHPLPPSPGPEQTVPPQRALLTPSILACCPLVYSSLPGNKATKPLESQPARPHTRGPAEGARQRPNTRGGLCTLGPLPALPDSTLLHSGVNPDGGSVGRPVLPAGDRMGKCRPRTLPDKAGREHLGKGPWTDGCPLCLWASSGLNRTIHCWSPSESHPQGAQPKKEQWGGACCPGPAQGA